MIVIAMDSTAYITRQEAKDLGVVFIPMTYSIGDESYTENFIRENSNFHNAALAKPGSLHTSQPVMGAFLRRFHRFVDNGYEILCLTISSRLSGTFSNASICAKSFGGRVEVVDSKTSAAGMYLLAKYAKSLIDQGLSLQDIAQQLRQRLDMVDTMFSVTDLAPLRRSGRLGMVRQSIGTILNQRPLLTLTNGAVVCVGIARGRNEQLRKLMDAVPRDAGEVVVQYFSEYDPAHALAQLISARDGRQVQIRRIGIVLAVHLGFDVVGVAWTK